MKQIRNQSEEIGAREGVIKSVLMVMSAGFGARLKIHRNKTRRRRCVAHNVLFCFVYKLIVLSIFFVKKISRNMFVRTHTEYLYLTSWDLKIKLHNSIHQ